MAPVRPPRRPSPPRNPRQGCVAAGAGRAVSHRGMGGLLVEAALSRYIITKINGVFSSRLPGSQGRIITRRLSTPGAVGDERPAHELARVDRGPWQVPPNLHPASLADCPRPIFLLGGLLKFNLHKHEVRHKLPQARVLGLEVGKALGFLLKLASLGLRFFAPSVQGHNAHAGGLCNIVLQPALPRQIVCLREHGGDCRRKMLSFAVD
jgi:hypothetical protein